MIEYAAASIHVQNPITLRFCRVGFVEDFGLVDFFSKKSSFGRIPKRRDHGAMALGVAADKDDTWLDSLAAVGKLGRSQRHRVKIVYPDGEIHLLTCIALVQRPGDVRRPLADLQLHLVRRPQVRNARSLSGGEFVGAPTQK